MSDQIFEGGAEWQEAWRAAPQSARWRIAWAIHFGRAVNVRYAGLAVGLANRWLRYLRWVPSFLALGAVLIFGAGTLSGYSPWGWIVAFLLAEGLATVLTLYVFRRAAARNRSIADG